MFPSRKTIYLLMFLTYVVVQECKADQVQGYSRATKCKTADCPSYSVIFSGKEFEIRSYDEALWMASSPFPIDSVMDAFSTYGLRTYFDGENVEGVKIDVSLSPLLIDYLSPMYIDYYYLPKKYQNGTIPKPKSSDVMPVRLPKSKYAAVRRFKDLRNLDPSIAVAIDELKKNLKGTTYQRAAEPNYFTVALYVYGTFSEIEFCEVLLWFN